jgi:teichuronic acid biosynthesis glycosyltransferase TuaC
MRLLVIAPYYHTFIKGLVEAEANYLEEVDVLIYHNRLVELTKYLPAFGYLRFARFFTKDKIVDLNKKPKNVDVRLISTISFTNLSFSSKRKTHWENVANKFERILRDDKIEFDLFHAHFTWPWGYIGVKLKEKFEVPLIITGHGYDVYDLPFRNRRYFEMVRETLSSADRIITVSHGNFKFIKKLGIKTKTEVIPNGFDSKLFYPIDSRNCREVLGLPVNKKIILNVGHLEKVKGHEYLIEAMKKIVKKGGNVLCIIVGDGSLRGKLEKQIKKLKLGDYVKLVGAKPHDEIPYWMNACDVFVLPSLSEGNPIVMFEVLACGKPFVGTKVGGIPEIITSEDYGLLCEPANPEDLAENILVALEKEWDSEKIRKYAERFSWENIAKKIVEIYEEVINEKE